MPTRRQFIASAVFAALGAHVSSSTANTRQAYAWTSLPGADALEIPSGDAGVDELWLYSDKFSYQPGEDLILYIHSTHPEVSLTIEREGGEIQQVYQQSAVKGGIQSTPENAYAVGCGWQESFRVKLPADWRSGVYVITLKAPCDQGSEIIAEHMFVLRSSVPGSHSKTVYMLPTSTYLAYNDWGGANYYRTRDTDEANAVVSNQRPWAKGFVRLPENAPRHDSGEKIKAFEHPRFKAIEWALENDFSRHYADSGFAYFDSHFIRFMENNGLQADYITQHDLHADPDLLRHYELLVTSGHDEYWSHEMRDALDAHLERGGKLARFGGNQLWQVRIEANGTQQICYKTPEEDPLYGKGQNHLVTTSWDTPVVDRSVAASFGLTGTAGVYANYGATTPRSAGGFTVYRPEHWVFEGTDLYYGDVLGAHPTSIVSYEADGLDYTFKNGLPFPTHKDGAPKDTLILALTPAIKGEEDHFNGQRLQNAPLAEFEQFAASVREELGLLYWFVKGKIDWALSPYGCAAIVVCSVGKGTVFNAGTTCWVHGLRDADFFVEQITRNVLKRLSSGSDSV
jgi:hypothetical protein